MRVTADRATHGIPVMQESAAHIRLAYTGYRTGRVVFSLLIMLIKAGRSSRILKPSWRKVGGLFTVIT